LGYVVVALYGLAVRHKMKDELPAHR